MGCRAKTVLDERRFHGGETKRTPDAKETFDFKYLFAGALPERLSLRAPIIDSFGNYFPLSSFHLIFLNAVEPKKCGGTSR